MTARGSFGVRLSFATPRRPAWHADKLVRITHISSMAKRDVVIVGGGPTGLMLAGELALAKVDVLIVERRATQHVVGVRAGGLHARTIELLDQRGIAERFLSAGKVAQVATFADAVLDLSDFPTRHPYGLALRQERIEQLLAAWVDELGVPILREREVTDVSQDGSRARVQLATGETIDAAFVVGCDGGRSLVRKRAGIAFSGWEPSVSYLIAEARAADDAPWGIRRGDRGISAIGKLEDGTVRIVLCEAEVHDGDSPTIDELRAALVAAYGTDIGLHSVTWLSRFTDATRQADSYRNGRLLIAGDAAHVHSPAGGQGLNLGLHDAMNLGWKLAQVVRGLSPETFLDTYCAERHPVTARILQATMAVTAINRSDARTTALRATMCDVLTLDDPRKRHAGRMSGLDIHYDFGAAHPLLGRRMPDLDVNTPLGTRRVFTLLHRARPVLLQLGPQKPLDVSGWSERVEHVTASFEGSWDLPVIGAVTAPTAVLVRPDGYVAWVGLGTDDGLHDALMRSFGPPSAA